MQISFIFRFTPLYISYFLCNTKLEKRIVLKHDLCHIWAFPDSRRHLRLSFPFSISFLCTFLSCLDSRPSISFISSAALSWRDEVVLKIRPSARDRPSDGLTVRPADRPSVRPTDGIVRAGLKKC